MDKRDEMAAEIERLLDQRPSQSKGNEPLPTTTDNIQSQLLLQGRIDDALRRKFIMDSPLPSTETLSQIEQRTEAIRLNRRRNRRLAIGLGIAAAVTLLVGGTWQFLGAGRHEPVFRPVSLAQIHRETVQRGFTPYYECHDMKRFAGTIRHRHGVGLTLLDLPDDRRMLGLSYLAGLSRHSTAMLCLVQNQPVIVFIDKTKNLDPRILESSTDPALSIFCREAFGLIFCEVTPLSEPAMLDTFALEPQPDRFRPD